jgi:hypothetical protein
MCLFVGPTFPRIGLGVYDKNGDRPTPFRGLNRHSLREVLDQEFHMVDILHKGGIESSSLSKAYTALTTLAVLIDSFSEAGSS